MRTLRSALAALFLMGAALPAAADTVEDKPRLAVTISGAPQTFVRALATRLAAQKRFVIVEGAAAQAARGRLNGIQLNGGFTPSDAAKARRAANVELLLDGRWQSAGGGQGRLVTRLFDFRTGEFSRDLSLIGDQNGADALAGQLAGYVRHAAPLRCLVKDLEEDQLILDLGEADGVQVGTMFRVYRHPSNMKPRELGLVRVTAVQPFASRAEVEEAPKGTTFERGDTLVEKTADYLFK